MYMTGVQVLIESCIKTLVNYTVNDSRLKLHNDFWTHAMLPMKITGNDGTFYDKIPIKNVNKVEF